MPDDRRVVALLGVGVVSADTPVLRADDLGVLRGDGVFETMHIRDGRAWLLDRHLDRMARSARLMDLELPKRDNLTQLAESALAAWPDGVEGMLRMVCTRGIEHTDAAATVFATATAVPEDLRLARHEGIGVISASLGFPAGLRRSAPWLLGGAKTLSYAVNMASQRWARSAGADDVLWVSGDGYALESPTSSLVWLESSTLCTVPPGQTGVLAGITAAWLLDHAGELGWNTAERMVTPGEMGRADGVWLTSSVRGVAAVRTIDGAKMPHSDEITGRIRDLLGYA